MKCQAVEMAKAKRYMDDENYVIESKYSLPGECITMVATSRFKLDGPPVTESVLFHDIVSRFTPSEIDGIRTIECRQWTPDLPLIPALPHATTTFTFAPGQLRSYRS
ncbi:MAG: hypothetical protein WC483_01065 [Candidatus Paceibacterota bacterium]